ncbi:MAG: hypothetical protein U0Q14_10825 [Dermatophilaceae bacterium]
MPLLAIGVSHHDVDSEQLGTLAARTDALVGILGGHRDSLNGWVLLTTCNRVEVYLDAPRFHPAVDAVLAAWRGCGASDAVLAAVQVHAGEAAVAHLFEVAAGLDSMVIGENEIHGQVRAALAAADGSATATLRRAFQDALSTAKTITTATAIGATGRSVASVGLDLLAERHSLVPPSSPAPMSLLADLLRPDVADRLRSSVPEVIRCSAASSSSASTLPRSACRSPPRDWSTLAPPRRSHRSCRA